MRLSLHYTPPPCLAYLSLHVSLLNSVADNLAVAVVFGRLPLQRGVGAPDVGYAHGDGRAGFL